MERSTRQRSAIERVFADATHPLDPSEVLVAARRFVPRMGIATVYRAIRSLVESGQVVAVILPGEATRYEAAGREHHHHFQCRRCHKVFELEGCSGDFGVGMPPGFHLESHEVVLYGRCDQCAPGV
jgi:Fur family ferric uptake transcriptional regulator